MCTIDELEVEINRLTSSWLLPVQQLPFILRMGRAVTAATERTQMAKWEEIFVGTMAVGSVIVVLYLYFFHFELFPVISEVAWRCRHIAPGTSGLC